MAVRVAFVNSLRRAVRNRVAQGVDIGKGWDRGIVASIVVVRAVSADENHWSTWLGEGVLGEGGTSQLLNLLDRLG